MTDPDRNWMPPSRKLLGGMKFPPASPLPKPLIPSPIGTWDCEPLAPNPTPSVCACVLVCACVCEFWSEVTSEFLDK
jgi:hypothetical protein